ncbi:MAG: stage V sporulation protein T, partial [Oscillospiraceae bacterium]|nr:stage V sporulation protein T [Oscillospiraceae bacterium]
VQRLCDSAETMITRLNADLEKENDDVTETEQSADHLSEALEELEEELRITKRQRIRDILKHPSQEALLEETYDALESDLQSKIEGMNHQIELLSDKRNTIIRVNRAAKTALEVFHDILEKEKLDRRDLELVIKKIRVFEDHLEVELQSDVGAILHADNYENTVNFKEDIIDPTVTLVQRSKNCPDKVYDVHVVSDVDPLEIYTDRDGEVIFKKYSPMGEMADFAAQLCDTLTKTAGYPALIADRDTVIAASGARRRDMLDKRLSESVERMMENRQQYCASPSTGKAQVLEGLEDVYAGVVSPIISEGDVSGAVIFTQPDGAAWPSDTELKLCQTVAGFLSRQMEA